MNLFGKFPLVRLKQLHDNPRALWYYLARLFYFKSISDRFVPLYKGHHFLTPQESLAYLLDNRVSLARFNDGEMGMLTGFGIYPPDSDWSQRYSNTLKARLIETLSSERDDLLIAVPPPHVFLASRTEARERGELYTMWTDTRIFLHRYLRKGRPYADANLFIPAHHPDFDWERFRTHLKERDVVIVTGGTNGLYSVSLGRRMFFIEAGKVDAFERYAQIRSDLDKLIHREGLTKEGTLILASLGTTADVLALDLTRDGWQIWDTGHFFRYADRKAFVAGDRKVFSKQMHGRTPDAVREAFEKCQTLYRAALGVTNLVMAEPLSHTATTIVFERLDLPPSLHDTLASGRADEGDFGALGSSLGTLHRSLETGDEMIPVHGDLWLHNVAVKGGLVYLFDAEAPALATSLDEHSKNSRYFDLASLVISVFLSGSFKQPWKLLSHSRRHLVRAFLKTYAEAYGVPVDAEKLDQYMRRELARWRTWQDSYGHHALKTLIKYAFSSIVIRHHVKNGMLSV